MSAGSLSVDRMSVTWGTHTVVREASLEFQGGRVHALLGPNGSGKSSLIKALAGLAGVAPGAAFTGPDGRTRARLTARERSEWGMAFVHQDLGLIPELSVTDNYYLGSDWWPRRRHGAVDWSTARQRCRTALLEVGLDLDPRVPLARMGRREQIQVAVGRALMDLPDGGGFLFVDEVTAYLDEREATQLLNRLRGLAEQRGTSIVFVTHRLGEVRDHADWVTIMRDGAVALDVEGDKTSSDALRSALGASHRPAGPAGTVRSLPGRRRGTPAATDAPLFVLRTGDEAGSGGPGVAIELQVQPGEVLGVTGLEGEGKEYLADVLSGTTALSHGAARLDGHEVDLRSRGDLVQRGMAFVPADRLHEGGIPTLSVMDNLLLASYARHAPRGRFQSKQAQKWSQDRLRQYAVTPADPAAAFASLSGGNQQKVILGRWLSTDCRLLVLHEPTAGVDVGARERIYAELRASADTGVGVLVITSAVDEAVTLCDRVMVLVGGRTQAILSGEDLVAERVVDASFGLREPTAQTGRTPS